MPNLSLDWFLFVLRIAFIVLLYLFLYQVVRVTFKDLVSRAEESQSGVSAAPVRAGAHVAVLIMAEPGATGLPAGLDVPLAPATSIGRHPSNLMPLEDPSVSGEHAEITLERGRWWVRDLGSTNGTFVNGSRIEGAAPLRSGDLVQFGRVSGRFQT